MFKGCLRLLQPHPCAVTLGFTPGSLTGFLRSKHPPIQWIACGPVFGSPG